MDKLTRQQEDIICKLLHHSHSEEVTQYILCRIGRENWTRDVLSSCAEFHTLEQEDLYESLGGGYDADEIDEIIECDAINEEIAEQLKLQGITSYLYENEDYLNAIRTGEIVIEGIDVEQIKMLVVEEQQTISHTE